jgi:hypothetical protein
VQLANATRDVGKVCASSSSGRVTAITLTEDQRSELEKTLAYKVTLLTMAHKVPVRIRHELNRLYKEVSSEFLDSLRCVFRTQYVFFFSSAREFQIAAPQALPQRGAAEPDQVRAHSTVEQDGGRDEGATNGVRETAYKSPLF